MMVSCVNDIIVVCLLMVVWVGDAWISRDLKVAVSRTYHTLQSTSELQVTSIPEVNPFKVYDIDHSRTRFCARVAYDGTNFHGWQEQAAKIRTVQGALGHTLSKRLGFPLRVTGAGRTDHGVHAKGQCIHFDIPNEQAAQLLEPRALSKSKALEDGMSHFAFTWNAILPPDVKVYNISVAPSGNAEQLLTGEPFHATKSAMGKRYIYRFCINPFIDPLKRHQYTHIQHFRHLDLALFETCLQTFIGTYDFSAFGNKIESTAAEYQRTKQFITLNTTRTIHAIELISEESIHGPGYYRIEFFIQSALYRMIRNIVGTSLYVATNQMKLETLRKLLYEGLDRKQNTAKSAPPEGLTLDHVFYDHY